MSGNLAVIRCRRLESVPCVAFASRRYNFRRPSDRLGVTRRDAYLPISVHEL